MVNGPAGAPLTLLDGTVVVDLLPPELAMTGAVLAHLGATVQRVSTDHGADGRADRRWREASSVWWRESDEIREGSPAHRQLLARADVVLQWASGSRSPSVGRASPSGSGGGGHGRRPVTVTVSAFGARGPRATWLASDLGIAAASGNLWATGDPDRPPVRCAAPLSAVHLGAEAAMAALTALAGDASGADVSMAETMCGACLGGPAMVGFMGERGQRTGSVIGITQEIWRCKDGWVSFGLRGGPARVPSLRTLGELAARRGDGRLASVEWESYNPRTAEPVFLTELTEVLGALFEGLTLSELEALATEHGVLVAPIADAAAIKESPQLEARGFFGRDGLPLSFVAGRRPGGAWGWLRPPASPVAGGEASATPGSPTSPTNRTALDPSDDRTTSPGNGHNEAVAPWAGTRLLVLGSGVAGPLIGRYFAEQGATVVRVESAARPDFLRLYAAGPQNPLGLEGSAQFAWANTGMHGLTLDLKQPEGRRLLLELVRRSHAVVENFTTSTLDRLDLGWEVLARAQPSLVLLSTSFNGQTGPRRHEAGFGALGSALSGFNYLTGWPDRAPIGPATTITDSLNPRFGAAALAAALLHARASGEGVHLDLSQVETALFSLTPWLQRRASNVAWQREGNRAEGAVPHGLYPCQGDDRWVALAAWSDGEWSTLRDSIGWTGPPCASLEARAALADAIDAAVTSYTSRRPADTVASELQARGVEAVPVADYLDLVNDPTLAARGHFVRLDHPALGPVLVERSGYRLDPDLGGYGRPAPTMGRDNRVVLRDVLRLSEEGIEELMRSEALR